MFSVIRHIIKKEFIQTFRDRRMLIPLFVAPVLQLILFGYAATTDIRQISVGVLDYDRSRESRSIISAFSTTETFALRSLPDSYSDIERLIQGSKIQAAVVIPEKFGKNIRKSTGSSLQVILDGTDANSATIIMSTISQLLAEHTENIIAEWWGTRPAGMIRSQPRIWFNPELKSSLYMVPGVICLILLLTTLLLTSMAITKEREMGTLEQLIVSPIKSHELIIGKTAPFILIGFCEIGLILTAGKLIFGLPVRGSILFLFVMSLIFILTTLGLGLFISTVSRTQQQAMMTALFIIMPAMLLSGIFSPIESMPRIIQFITLLNPLRYFSKAVRGILLKGNGFADLKAEAVALLVFGLAAIVLSALRFRKHLE
jgi:ABC-2 type transport system permease protein